MAWQSELYFEGVTRRDAEHLDLVLKGKPVDSVLVRRLCSKGWIEPVEHGYLITWAGRCVIESATPRLSE